MSLSLPRQFHQRLHQDDQACGIVDELDVVDAHVRIEGPCQGHWPAMEWNLRKAYTLLFWLRVNPPETKTEMKAEKAEKDEANIDNDSESEESEEEEEIAEAGLNGIWYRFGSSQHEIGGMSVTGMEWKLDGGHMETILRAQVGDESNFTTLRIPADGEFHLVSFSHVFPYLKRPTWSIQVDGEILCTLDLSYPFSNDHTAVPLDDAQVLTNVVAPGWSMDVCAMSLYPSSIPYSIQAVVAEAGPNMALHSKDGRIIPVLPTVCNWSKGSNLEGPKVGIPLNVHTVSLEIQRLSSTAVFSCHALHTTELGGESHKRILWTPELQAGDSTDTPRVGLVRPGPVIRRTEDSPHLYMTGRCKLVHLQQKYMKKHGLSASTAENVTSSLFIVLQEQRLLAALLLPFYMAICPPTKAFDMAPELYANSLDSLQKLYCNQGAEAARRLRSIAEYIRKGRARVAEEVLQIGALHILAVSLRLGLIRAHKFRIFSNEPMSAAELMKKCQGVVKNEDGTPSQLSQSNTCPSHIPEEIIKASVEIVRACCGPSSPTMGDLTPSMQIRRTGDLSLTAVFGFVLDWDLWGTTAGPLVRAVADRFGGTCLTCGYIMRSQTSVQHFLDGLRTRMANNSDEETCSALAELLQAMLLASLSNRRTVTQSEHDIAACVRLLTDCPLGHGAVHIVLTALIGILVWCDVVPPESLVHHSVEPTKDDEKQMQLASRLGRNLLISQFHDVVAPMVLARTAFSGERTLLVDNGDHGALRWENHWQLTLLLFSWVSSVAGPEGLLAAHSCGNLMLASSKAGSLNNALANCDKNVLTTMFMPPPGMALMIGSVFRNEWSYTDLLSDRLEIMMPLLPGMVVSLMSSKDQVSQSTIKVLSEVLDTVGSAFHRVFGGTMHSSTDDSIRSALPQQGSGIAIKAARTHVPHLLEVICELERCIRAVGDDPSESSSIEIMAPLASFDPKNRTVWGDASSISSESVLNEMHVSLPPGQDSYDSKTLISILASAQRSVMNTVAGLVTKAMSLGGSGTAFSLWNLILSNLRKAFDVKGDLTLSDTCTGLLCRLISLVFRKSIAQEHHLDKWTYELSSSVAKTCALVEGKELASKSDASWPLSRDKIVLVCVLLELLEHGREATGWCQLSLPSMSQRENVEAVGDISSASKLLLPVLQPTFRAVLPVSRSISPDETVYFNTVSDDSPEAETESFHGKVLAELDRTLTAAIVGLSFAGARDMALSAIAALRLEFSQRQSAGDESGVQLCGGLICKLCEELKVRYESEKRLRATSIFDVYENENEDAIQQAADGSQAVEELIFGDTNMGLTSLLDDPYHAGGTAAVSGKETINEDFVLFAGAETDSSANTQPASKFGFTDSKGLGSALESACKVEGDSVTSQASSMLEILKPYLDRWDAIISCGGEGSELVELFDSALQLSEEKQVNSSIPGSETAADAMSGFFELSTSEKTRIKEVSVRFMPSYRYSRFSFAERYCWSCIVSVSPPDSPIQAIFERSISDGNRDIRSRIATLPTFPQFRPYIPSYLDHGPASPKEDQSRKDPEVRISATQIDDITKTLLEAGDLEIVDITKKEADNTEDDVGLDAGKPDVLEEDMEGMYADTEDLGQPFDDTRTPSNRMDSSERTSEADVDGDTEEVTNEEDIKLDGMGSHSITTSSFSTAPDNASSSLGLMQSAAAGLIELNLDNCLHVKAEGSRSCTMLLTSTHLILEYESSPEGYFEGEILAGEEETERQRMIEEGGGLREGGADAALLRSASQRRREVASLRPKSIRYNLSEVSHIYLRRYRLRDSSLELFFIPSGGTTFGGMGLASCTCSVFLDFGPGNEGHTRRDDAAFALMRRSPPQAVKQWPDRSIQFLHDQLRRLTIGWAEGRLTNFDYLLHLNMLAGRTYNDICQYPVFPWVLSNYTSQEIPDLTDKNNFRDLTKPVGALNPSRLEDFIERFETFADPSIPPFMYGSHYSTSAGVVLHFLVRLHPFAGLHRQLQGGHFDVADRLFSSVPRTWSMCTGSSAAEVKEITPEWYCNPSFLRNSNGFKLGTSQDGEKLADVMLPPWANESPERFVEVMRAALESDVCSSMLPDWIDLIFGFKQQGPESIKAHNVYFYLTYYGAVDLTSIKDEALRQATELQIAHFGQCPMQLFKNRPHVHKLKKKKNRVPFFQIISSLTRLPAKVTADHATEEPLYLPFYSAPLSHWVHLDAPPPGPHSPLVAVRFAGTDRCMAIDQKGIFHLFRWTWRSEESDDTGNENDHHDNGCFVAQRELPRFRSVPRLMFDTEGRGEVACAISKTLFSGRTVLLVLSAADATGSLGMQLVDPAKGNIRGEVSVSNVHSARITCIATDPIGTAAGHGGVGGELAVIGSADGTASLWRFMSSHYLPMRPRLILNGHGGDSIMAVSISAPIQLACSVSRNLCCFYSVTNGTLLLSMPCPTVVLNIEGMNETCSFANTKAVALSVQGLLLTVCESLLTGPDGSERKVASLVLFTVEGVLIGTKPLEPWRGLPHKIHCTPDGTAAMVCSGRGMSIHRLSALDPLEVIDEWHVTELDDLTSPDSIPACYDVEFGPSLNRPVLAAAACSNGALRLHALPGISAWSERHKKGGLGQTVGSALAKPARRLRSAVKDGLGLGRQIAGVGRDIGIEVSNDVKERGVSGFFNSMVFGKQKRDS